MSFSDWRAWPLLFMMQLLGNYVNIGVDANLYIPANAYYIISTIKDTVYLSIFDSPVV